MNWRGISLALLILLLGGCAGVNPQVYADQEPALDLFDYFEGESRAWGIFRDRAGEVRRRFTVDLVGTVEGDLLTLEEDFLYADGEQDRRVWRIRRVGPNRYEGRADDIIGVAAGEAHGPALNWQYDVALTVGERDVKVHFNDWMYLQPDGVLLNVAEVSKFGVRVGEVTIAFRRDQPA